MNTKAVALTLTGAALLAGCGTPGPNPALESARASYRAAAENPRVVQSAPDELARTEESLRRAEAAAKAGADKTEVDHLSYLADTRARIAMQRGELAEAQQSIENARAERERIVREARERQLAEERQVHQQQLARAQARASSAEQAAATQAQRAELMQRELQQLQARQTPAGMVMTLGDVLFDVGKATLKPGAKRSLDRLSNFMEKYPERKLRIEGFTDDTGSAETNQTLSQERAEAVRNQLIQRGVGAERMQAIGYGPAFPVASNRTAAGRQQNRRVEVVFSDEAGRFTERPKETNPTPP